MSAIAIGLLKKGYSISGSDLIENKQTDQLKKSGALIFNSQTKQNIIEVLTSLILTRTKNVSDTVNTIVVFATVVELIDEKIDKEQLERIVLIEVPSQIYSELRKIFVSLFEDSGFKDVKVSKSVDFEKLYTTRKIQ